MVGLSYAMELSTPFVALRAILRLFDVPKEALVYKANALLMLAIFFTTRIASLPMAYWMYSVQR